MHCAPYLSLEKEAISIWVLQQAGGAGALWVPLSRLDYFYYGCKTPELQGR